MALMTSCVSKKKFNQLMMDKDAVVKSLAEARNEVDSLNGVNQGLTDDLASANDKIGSLEDNLTKTQADLAMAAKEAEETKARLSEREAQLQQLEASVSGVFKPYTDSGMTLTKKGGKLYVTMAEPVLFKSGSVRVTKSGKAKLENLATILKNNPSLKIVVEGHTDDQMVKPGAGYRNNLHLSLVRAMNVTEALVKMGVAEGQVTPAGRGHYLATGSGEKQTPEERAQSRRVDFVIQPDVNGLYGKSNDKDMSMAN